MKYAEDPSIARVAEAEYRTMIGEVIRRYRQGDDWWHARTIVTAARGTEIARLYGKDVAERAVRAVMSHTPGDVTASVEADRRRFDAAQAIDTLDAVHGPGHRYSDAQLWAQENPRMGLHIGNVGLVVFGAGLMAFFPWAIGYGWRSAFWMAGFVTAAAVVIWLVAIYVDGLANGPPRRSKGAPVMTESELRAYRAKRFEEGMVEYRAEQQRLAEQQERADQLAKDQRSFKALLDRTARDIEREKRIAKGGKW